jgi:hypothetical protein
MTYTEWKQACLTTLEDIGLLIDDLWDSDDPYEIFRMSQEAYKAQQSPRSFVEDIFSEEIAQAEGEKQERRDAAVHYTDSEE